jgi:hypothetical protein
MTMARDGSRPTTKLISQVISTHWSVSFRDTLVIELSMRKPDSGLPSSVSPGVRASSR